MSAMCIAFNHLQRILSVRPFCWLNEIANKPKNEWIKLKGDWIIRNKLNGFFSLRAQNVNYVNRCANKVPDKRSR